MQPDQQQQFSEQLPSSGGNLFNPKNTDRIGPTCLEQVIPQADAVGFFLSASLIFTRACRLHSFAPRRYTVSPSGGTLRLTPFVSLRFGSSCLTKSSRKFIPKNLRPFTAAHNYIAAHNQFTISVQRSNYSLQGRLFLLLSPAAFPASPATEFRKNCQQRPFAKWTSSVFIQSDWRITNWCKAVAARKSLALDAVTLPRRTLRVYLPIGAVTVPRPTSVRS
jgi:hypothetical protein